MKYNRFLLLLICNLVIAISIYGQKTVYYPSKVVKAQYFRKTLPLREMKVILPGDRDRSWKDGIIRNEENIKSANIKDDNALYPGEDPVLQDYDGLVLHRGPILNFDGVGNVNGVIPPDTDGDVGPDHYFQMINLSFAIWDKEGNKLFGPVDNSTLWNGFIGPWTGTNDGDPIVLYDEMADRWLASQFAIFTSSGTFWQLIAISETGDPLGAYYQYAFEFPTFNDYPKFGIWHDAYYASFNMFGEYNRAATAAFDRDRMLEGDPDAGMVLFDLPSGSDPFSMLPSDFDGTPPPQGTPNYFVYFNDDTWGYAADQLRIWEFKVDWNEPAASTFTESMILQTEPFKSQLCDAPRWQCIPQPNTELKLEAISDRLMYRLQYRNFGEYAVMVTNHTVNVNNTGVAGIRWYELRDYHDGNGWSIYQQSTYSPDDNSRWMGSIAMNGNGTIALGYSISSDTICPSIRYTGRSPEAPLGEMNYTEIETISGLGSQGTYHRWGDYSMMSVDPVDDSTFWYTQEYSIGGWKTRICSFNFGPIIPPTVNVGPDTTICINEAFFRDPTAENFKNVFWTTSGDGFFQNPKRLKAAYLRGQEDINNGSVDLTLSVYGYLPGQTASDQLTLYIDSLPFADAGNDTIICTYNQYTLHGTAGNYSSVLWGTTGDGTFNDVTLLNAIYIPGTADTASGFVELFLTAYSLACEDSSISTMTLWFDPCFGIDEYDPASVRIRIFPNPNSGVFDLEVANIESKQLEIRMLNTKGQIIFNQLLTNFTGQFSKQFDMNLLEKGVYYIRIRVDGYSSTGKLIIR